MRVLVVTAVAAEHDAVAAARPAGSPHTVLVGGVGTAEAAAATATALAGADYGLVLCAGIGGGFAPLPLGAVAVAATIAFADLGAETPQGFRGAGELAFGTERYPVEPALAVAVAERTGGHLGTILTVATVTGTDATRDARAARYPDAVAEGMEGAGVAAAARRAGVAYAELRAISNAVGPRDRAAWRVPQALAALGPAVAAVLATEA